ncbi:MAG TPA: sn-glycerol-3-phosphate ABC transporter ATP-binding protein UgpC [Devosia sp.]
MSGLKLRDVKKAFGSVEVIKGVDLDIADKEFVVFVGPSGCGKSTLLRMIAGLESVTGGDLFIGDQRMNEVDPSKRGIAMVFQSYALYPHMTVRENMGFALKFAGMPKAEIEKQVNEAARILELGPLLDRLPKQLSGGQRQRVAIGRAIVRHPQVFLFDEPLSNLDAELRVHMRIELARLHKELATTIVYVTHDQVEAMTLADKIVVLRAGEIAQVGTPLQLFDDPDNLFVAGFIGSPKMNLLKGIVVSNAGGTLTVRLPDYGDQTIAVPAPAVPLAAETPLTIGIRPGHFSDDGAISLDLTVELVEHLGNETFAYAGQGNGDLITIGMHNDRALAAGQALKAKFDPAKVLLFGADEQRIR